MADWISIAEKLPPENKVVETRIDDGEYIRNEQKLKRCGNLWWLPDGSMYVYYMPTHWRQLEGEERHMTNADRIRAMSDWELAKLMANPCQCVDSDCNGYRDCGDDSCIKHLLEWLRQPAEEDI